jgi:hypothetical protein
MNNTLEITTDSINVFVTAKVKADLIGKWVLTVFNIGLLIVYIAIIVNVEQSEIGKFFIPIILMFFPCVFFPWKYWFWNFFGKEFIIVNTKTITHYHDYGIVVQTPKTLTHRSLATSYELVKMEDGREYGRLHFISYDEQTDLPEKIFQTSVILSKEELESIQEHLKKIFIKKAT